MNGMQTVIGIDAGGTEIKAGVIRGDEVLAERRWATGRENGPDHARDQILLAARELYSEYPEARAIGLVVPGIVDVDRKIAVFSENIRWRDVPFGELLHEITGLPVGFGHDVRAAGIAEASVGNTGPVQNSLFLALGTGIAGAIIVNGELFENPYAGEIGHLDVDSGLPCACGGNGCLETTATGPSIASLYNSSSGGSAKNSRDVLEAAKSGDQVAIAVWENATNSIGRALTAYITLLAPEVIILGGGLSKAGSDLLDPINKYFDTHLTFQPRPQLTLATLGDIAGMIGAGLLAKRVLS
jgi:glucokinase